MRRRMLALQAAPGAPRYLIEDMIDDVLERTAFVRIEARRALVIGDFTGTLAAALSAKDIAVIAAEPAAGFDEEQPYPAADVRSCHQPRHTRYGQRPSGRTDPHSPRTRARRDDARKLRRRGKPASIARGHGRWRRTARSAPDPPANRRTCRCAVASTRRPRRSCRRQSHAHGALWIVSPAGCRSQDARTLERPSRGQAHHSARMRWNEPRRHSCSNRATGVCANNSRSLR